MFIECNEGKNLLFGQLFTCDGLAIMVASGSTKCECIEWWMFMSLGKRAENSNQEEITVFSDLTWTSEFNIFLAEP